jgi:hypothetical protein
MQTRRTDAGERRKGVWRLYDPQRRCFSVRLWFDYSRAKQVARRWMAKQQQPQLFQDR